MVSLAQRPRQQQELLDRILERVSAPPAQQVPATPRPPTPRPRPTPAITREVAMQDLPNQVAPPLPAPSPLSPPPPAPSPPPTAARTSGQRPPRPPVAAPLPPLPPQGRSFADVATISLSGELKVA